LVFGQLLSGLSPALRESIKARARRVYRAIRGRRVAVRMRSIMLSGCFGLWLLVGD
jgi:hypothetical protein